MRIQISSRGWNVWYRFSPAESLFSVPTQMITGFPSTELTEADRFFCIFQCDSLLLLSSDERIHLLRSKRLRNLKKRKKLKTAS